MEELVLTDPIVKPEEVTSKYKVISFFMSTENLSAIPEEHEPGLVTINLRDNLGKLFVHNYMGQQAIDYIKFINTANFSTKSLHKRILERLSNDGVLPGTVTGVPDPPTGS